MPVTTLLSMMACREFSEPIDFPIKCTCIIKYYVVCFCIQMQGELYGTYKPNENYFLTLAWKTLKENCKSLSKFGELNHREEKINVILTTGAYNVTLTMRRRKRRRYTLCSLSWMCYKVVVLPNQATFKCLPGLFGTLPGLWGRQVIRIGEY